jgi:hypothetical protein
MPARDGILQQIFYACLVYNKPPIKSRRLNPPDIVIFLEILLPVIPEFLALSEEYPGTRIAIGLPFSKIPIS